MDVMRESASELELNVIQKTRMEYSNISWAANSVRSLFLAHLTFAAWLESYN